MNSDRRCFCELAPLYALDLLDLEERLWVETQVLECPDLAEELAGYQDAVGLLPYAAPPIPMAADLKDRLFDRLGLAAISAEAISSPGISPDPGMFAIRSGDRQWQPHRMPGVEVVVLFDDAVSRMRSLVVKVAAGVTYPLHQHHGIEEIYMLDGELDLLGEIYLAGDYIRSHPNSCHAPSTNTGCMFLIRACMDDDYNLQSG
ncbi:cupin domain-containing protein [Chamaesiphon sp. OTE_75_metabat_556]|uniref:cupin domain-containing protein n=1 Tax=Chamaesiphon sp. OTE_75_metabat_556 TaxID=2964692 RepID=UPI00286CE2F1|nr:cupin domain-containing protein [Chamaesiphon sp. OTE_75_metabat_556]